MAGASFYMFWFRFIPEMLSALSAAFLCSRAFRLFFCSFGCPLFCRLFGFRELNEANVNGNGNECDGCVSVSYNFLLISLLLFSKVHKTTTWNRHISSAYLRERELYDGQFLKFLLSSFEAVLHYITISVLRQTEWIQLLARFVGWILSRFLTDVVFGVVHRCCLSCFFIFGQRASACTFDHLFVRLPSLCLEVYLLV